MSDQIQDLLNAFPEGVVQLRDGVVHAANAMARHCLPQLKEGAPCPAEIPLPRNGPVGAGSFTAEGAAYTCSCAGNGGEQFLLFRPAPQTALTGRQLEGVLVQLRSLLGEVLAEVGPATGPSGGPLFAAAFGKSFHRLFRLVENLEYMQQAAGEEGVPFRPKTIDLEGLCRDVVREARPLLYEAGISLDYETALTGQLFHGDPKLLQQLLLELIANAARAAEGGRVTLSLRRKGGRALLTVSHNGPLPDERQIASLFQREAGEELPRPGQGAGLGLAIARDIVSRHGGSFLVEWGQSAPSVIVSLPIGPLDGRTQVKQSVPQQDGDGGLDPVFQRDGGLDPVLTKLSDLLPERVFELEGLD